MPRSKPDSRKMPSSIETEEFLRKARAFRRDMITYAQKWPTISGARNSTDAVQRTIDDLAWGSNRESRALLDAAAFDAVEVDRQGLSALSED